MQVRITKEADKEIRRIGPAGKRIAAKIRQYAADPESLANNVKSLKGSSTLRLRVGDHRVIFEIEGDTMIVLKVRTRGEAYD